MAREKGFKIDPSWKGVIKWGGLSLLAAAFILVIFVFLVFITQQTLPVPAEEILEDPTGPTLLFLLAAIGELLLLPGGLALYFSLKDVKKTPMFIATGFWVVGIPMFLASRGLIISLTQISGRYINATSETMKAAYMASAELALEIQNIYATMGVTLVLCVAPIIIGIVMLKGGFGKIGYLVITAGILTLFTPFGVILSVPIILPFIGLALTAVWQLVVGIKLYKLGKNV
ncbi:hypothetical protein ACFLTG_00065 [Chloroflexota bacterium]